MKCIPVDLDKACQFIGREPEDIPYQGWGVDVEGEGLLNLPALTERQAQQLCDRLNTPEGSDWPDHSGVLPSHTVRRDVDGLGMG